MSSTTGTYVALGICGGQHFDGGYIGMSASRRRRAGTQKSVAVAEATPVVPIEREIRRELASSVKRRLGLSEADKIPLEIEGLVDSAAHELAGNEVSRAVLQSVSQLRTSSLTHDGRASTAPRDDALREAERLAAKKKALRVAGFSNDEAMRILVAEVTGMAARG